jgi:hypothetical protein
MSGPPVIPQRTGELNWDGSCQMPSWPPVGPDERAAG